MPILFRIFLLTFLAWTGSSQAAELTAFELNQVMETIESLTPERKTELAERLRQTVPMPITHLSLLLLTQQIKPHELVRWFNLTSVHFGKIVERSRAIDPDAQVPQSNNFAFNSVLSSAIELVRQRILRNDAKTLSALDAGHINALRSNGPHYTRADRLLFYQMLFEGSLNWLDRSTWMERSRRAQMPLRLYRDVGGNVVLVHFGVFRPCQALLEAPTNVDIVSAP